MEPNKTQKGAQRRFLHATENNVENCCVYAQREHKLCTSRMINFFAKRQRSTMYATAI